MAQEPQHRVYIYIEYVFFFLEACTDTCKAFTGLKDDNYEPDFTISIWHGCVDALKT